VIQVVIPSGLRKLTGDVAEVQLAVKDVRGAVAALDARFPGFAVAIDGEILNDAWHEPLPAGSELHFLPALSGGV